MHKLTQLLFEEGHFSGHRKPIEADKTIRDFLNGRCEHLTAKEIQEKYNINTKCCTCNVSGDETCPIHKQIQSLPSRINIEEGEYVEMRLINAVNDLIEYLHTKESGEK